MKNSLKISVLSVASVLCATVVAGAAQAASAVRSFGGTGTYNSASSAAAARNNSIGSVRAASVRPSVPKVGTGGSTTGSTGGTTSGGSVSSGSKPYSSRLSVGKYLSQGQTISGGGAIQSQNPGTSGSTNNSQTTVLQDRIDVIEGRVDDLDAFKDDQYTSSEIDDMFDEVDDKLADKQDALTAGTGIDITDNVISSTVVDGREIELQAVGNEIQWKYSDQATWESLIDLPDLTGYLTDTEVEAAINDAILTALSTIDPRYATAAQGAKADAAAPAADFVGPTDDYYIMAVKGDEKTWMKLIY